MDQQIFTQRERAIEQAESQRLRARSRGPAVWVDPAETGKALYFFEVYHAAVRRGQRELSKMQYYALHAYITEMDGRTGLTNPTIERVAELMGGVSQRNAQRATGGLMEAGWLVKWKAAPGSKMVRRVCVPNASAAAEGGGGAYPLFEEPPAQCAAPPPAQCAAPPPAQCAAPPPAQCAGGTPPTPYSANSYLLMQQHARAGAREPAQDRDATANAAAADFLDADLLADRIVDLGVDGRVAGDLARMPEMDLLAIEIVRRRIRQAKPRNPGGFAAKLLRDPEGLRRENEQAAPGSRVRLPRVQAPRVQAPRVQAPRVQAPRPKGQPARVEAPAPDAAARAQRLELDQLRAASPGDLAAAMELVCQSNDFARADWSSIAAADLLEGRAPMFRACVLAVLRESAPLRHFPP